MSWLILAGLCWGLFVPAVVVTFYCAIRGFTEIGVLR